ncbi:MAG: glycosyltransferase family 4 protein [Acidobacteriota bacterium]
MRNETKILKVIHVIESLGSGGAERLLYTNLKNLDPEKFQNTVIMVYPRGTHWLEPIQQLGVTTYCLDCNSYRNLPAGIKRLQALLRQEKPDLIHTHLWAANVIGRLAARRLGIPVISSIHNPDYDAEAWDTGSTVSRFKRGFFRAIDSWTARRACNRMIAVSEYVKARANLHLSFPTERIDLLYNPIDIAKFQAPPTRKREDLLNECGIPKESILLLNISRISRQKGLLYAIRALPKIREQFPTAHLVSIGAQNDSGYLGLIKQESIAWGVSDAVHLLGVRSDVSDWLHYCDLFVFPSLYEGLGIALIEAMAVGCVCVASQMPPIPEIIEHQVDGWLVPPKDAQAIADAVCLLLSDPVRRQTLKEAAVKSVSHRFHPVPAAETLARIYEQVINQTQAKNDDPRVEAVAMNHQK